MKIAISPWASPALWTVLCVSWLGPQVLAQTAATLEPPATTKSAAVPQPSLATEPAQQKSAAMPAGEEAEPPEFVRVFSVKTVPKALQTAVATYRKPGDNSGLEVVLIGAVHIGEPSYYSELNQLFKTFDGLLYELVADPGAGVPDPKERGLSPVSAIQVGMKDSLDLTFQLDEVDYKAKNFIHADMTPAEFFTAMEARKEGVMQMLLRSIGSGLAMQSAGKGGDVGLLAALVSNDRPRALRRAFAEQMQMMDGQMAAITGDDGKSTLITERNAKALVVLDREIKAGKKKLGIFYGAGHLKDMHTRLQKDFGMELVETKWLDAWGL